MGGAIIGVLVGAGLAACAPEEQPQPSASSVLPSPPGGFTASGTTLRLGEAATVPWEPVLSDGPTGVLRITITSVEMGSRGDLFPNTAATPVYVTERVENVGSAPIDPQGTFEHMNVYYPDGDALESPTKLGDFAECEDGELDRLAVGERFTHCNLYSGSEIRPAKVVFSEKVFVDNVNRREFTLTWTVP